MVAFIWSTGSGKTTACKHILFNEFLVGIKLLIADPEAEYIEFARNLRGNVIDLSGIHRYNVLAVEKGIVTFAGVQSGYGYDINPKGYIYSEY